MPELKSIKAPTDNDWISNRAAVMFGLAGLVPTVALLAILDERIAGEVTAATVAMVYGVYAGFAIKSGQLKDLAFEGGFILVGLTTVVLGLEHGPHWLAVGLVLHGVWDLLHHPARKVAGTDGVPAWYVPFCAVYDISAAIAIAILL
jgi:hypothetical protein